MYRIFLCLAICSTTLFAMSCNSTKQNSKPEPSNHSATKTNTEMGNSEYHEMKKGESLTAFLNKKVVFEGTISKNYMQHMMKGSFPMDNKKEDHKYIDPAEHYDFGQLLAYYFSDEVKWPSEKEGQVYRLYGTVGVVSGGGKGGGEHSEEYLLLEKVELK